MAIDPTGRDLKKLRNDDPGGPVVMLNLLRFKPGGRASYDAYAEAAGRFITQHGGRVLYAGDGDAALVAEEGQAWDAVLVVQYPSRQAFLDMVADPDYQAITHLRSDALEEAVLQPTVPWAS